MVSLKEVVYNYYVDSVTMPTKSGEIAVLPHTFHSCRILRKKLSARISKTSRKHLKLLAGLWRYRVIADPQFF
ncbi:MAG: hypothetical protein EXS51_00920 [Candidatus Taylorbacteria bacterium]|nr:hypothetical protein [Candidatus Taylorbacteria bacterium]